MNVTCIDFQQKMLDALPRRFPSLKFNTICDSMPDLKKTPRDSFDFVFSEGVTEHFMEREERVQCHRTLFELLRNGGIVCNIVPYKTPEPDEYQYESQEEAIKEFTEGGHQLCWGYCLEAEMTDKRKRGYLCVISKKLSKARQKRVMEMLQEQKKLEQKA